MASGQQIAFQPAFAHLFTEDFHDPTVGRQVHIVWLQRLHPCFGADLVDRIQSIRRRFIGAEQTEVFR
ncbi:hypothetical protein D3C78_1874390 [compost metagenome]